jgi:hypothetical protein
MDGATKALAAHLGRLEALLLKIDSRLDQIQERDRERTELLKQGIAIANRDFMPR